jgi:3-oxoacyl-[acyl-carrier protein] reductase
MAQQQRQQRQGQRGQAQGSRPVVLVTGVGREAGIGAGIALRLAEAGWDVAYGFWQAYDARRPWGADAEGRQRLRERLTAAGARCVAVEADLSDTGTPAALFDAAERALGPVTGLVLSHAESVDSGLLDTTVESFDLHFAVNARASWLLVREFALRFAGEAADGEGRIVALTSDHTAFNLPYGASKGALDRIVLSAAKELAGRGITANVVNPGPIDTGWMTDELKAAVVTDTPLGRLGTPSDTASLVAFLLSAEGAWINGQLLHSSGGFA